MAELTIEQKARFLEAIWKMAAYAGFVEYSRSSSDEILGLVRWLNKFYVTLDRNLDDDGLNGSDPTKAVWTVEVHEGDDDDLMPIVGVRDLHATDALRIAMEFASHYADR